MPHGAIGSVAAELHCDIIHVYDITHVSVEPV